jgi:hypothetical protein
LVLRISEPIRVDDWGFGRVCGVDGDVPPRIGCYKSRRDTGIVIAV